MSKFNNKNLLCKMLPEKNETSIEVDFENTLSQIALDGFGKYSSSGFGNTLSQIALWGFGLNCTVCYVHKVYSKSIDAR